MKEHEPLKRPTDEDTPQVAKLRAAFELVASDSFGFKRSRFGTYQNPQVARDWKWFRLGHLYTGEL